MKSGASLLVLCVSAISLAGCGTRPLKEANADGTYCYQAHPTKTCTREKIPPLEAEQQARLLSKSPSALTLYFVRSNWGDVVDKFSLTVDGQPPVEVVPHSFVRIQLPPGEHRLVAKGDNKSASLRINGGEGAVVVVEFAAQQGLLGNKVCMEKTDPEAASRLLRRSRMVADKRFL